jgi:hypothetical protein
MTPMVAWRRRPNDRRHLRGRSVTSQSFEIIGEDKTVIVLRDASGFDVLLTRIESEVPPASSGPTVSE